MQKKTFLTHCSKVFRTGLHFKLFILALLICLLPLSMAKADTPPTEVDEVSLWMRSGPEDWMWGYADLDAFVTVTKDATPLFTVQANSSGYWISPGHLEINPGDVFTVTAGAGINPIQVEIPPTFTVQADSATEEVSGQIQGWLSQTVSIFGDWPAGNQDVLTDENGNFSATYADITYGGSGHVFFQNMVSYAYIIYNQEFRTPDLVLETHYGYDWVQGHYDAGHTVNLTIFESDQATIKATTEVETGVVSQWFGETGFFTGEGDPWTPETPDIMPGDWVYGIFDNGFEAWARIGEITGSIDSSTDSVGGTLDASWLMPEPVDIECYIWVPSGPEGQYDTVIPNGSDTYECSWSGAWDIMPGDPIQVAYIEPEGHIVMRDFHEPAPYLKIEKWFMGNGSPGEGGNAAFYIRYINQGDAPAENVTITDTSIGLSYHGYNTSGLPTLVYPDHVVWQVGTLDPGDWIGFTYTEDIVALQGDPISNTVEITTTTYDQGEPWEKISTWEGVVAPNDTHLKVWKETWTWNPAPGEDFVYQVNLCNDGGTGSSTLTLTDTLPGAAAFNYWWSSEAGWYQINQTGQTLELRNYSLPPGTCSEIFINVTLDEFAESGDALVNQAEISADNDMETEDNISEIHHEVGEPFIDAAVWQEWHSGSLVPGGEYRLGIGYKNVGNVLIHAPVEITATLPSGVTFNSSDLTPTSMTSDTVTWVIGTDLIAGMEGMIELQLDIDPAVPPGTTLSTLADIVIPDDDENPENDHHELDVFVRESGLNLRVTKQGGWEGFDVGQVAWWHIQVENIGDEVAEDIVLIDYYPADMELMGAINVNYWEDWEWEDNNPEDNAFRVDFAGLEPGESIHISYRTYVREGVLVRPGIAFYNFVEVPNEGDIEPASNVYEMIILTPGFGTFMPLILR